MNFEKLDAMKARLESFRPLSPEMLSTPKVKTNPFLSLMAETVEEAFEPYWYVLGVGI